MLLFFLKLVKEEVACNSNATCSSFSFSKYFIASSINSFCQIGQRRKVEANKLYSPYPSQIQTKLKKPKTTYIFMASSCMNFSWGWYYCWCPPDSMASLWSRLWGSPDSALVLSHSWTAGGGGWSVRREGRWIVGDFVLLSMLFKTSRDLLSVNVSLNSHGLHPCLSQYWSIARTLLILNIIPTTTIASTSTQTEQMTFHSLTLLFFNHSFFMLVWVKLYDW